MTSDSSSPFHAEEVAIQQRLGVDVKMQEIGQKFIRDYMPDQHREFFAQIPFILLGAVDKHGQPWASILVGQPGFISSPNSKSLQIQSSLLLGDPLTDMLGVGVPIGLLGIELPTRRRNRMNGVISNYDNMSFAVDVIQSFGNCNQYIQKRKPTFVDTHPETSPIRIGQQLTASDRNLIGRADTFFIASANWNAEAHLRGVDVSHRGGRPGFVCVNADTLTIPDFSGNNFFNTLGNLLNYPQAGLLFIDFATGDLLYLAVIAEIIWEEDEVAVFEGAERLVRFTIQEVRFVSGVLPFRWSEPELSPFLIRTGSWPHNLDCVACEQKANSAGR
ncbi:MAG: pyridoxamine 5'-phosphate oxidase family protein [Leptolyngbyaceae cyanobacterium bins.302]|nr:pyridoxamine 5'-phosphate oxidase family protein [Leptolyngbyaceae cyanobacterium bins.302]